MSYGERIKAIRKELGLSQEAFGNKLGVGKTAISKIEKEERGLTEQMTKAICREYNVDYGWLTEGIGNMFIEVPEGLVEDLKKDYNLSEIEQQLLRSYLSMSHDDRQQFISFINRVVMQKDE